MLVVQEVGEGGTDEVHVEDVNVAGVATKGIVSATDDVVPTAVDESSIPSPTPPTPPPQPSQDQPSTPQVYLTPPQSPQSSTTITSTLTTTFIGCWITNDPSLKPNGHMVKKLERMNNLKVLKLRSLKRFGSNQRIYTSDDTVMDDVSKQGGVITNINVDEDVVLEDAKDVAVEKSADVEDNTDIEGRKAESQVEIYKIDLEHAKKVLSMIIIEVVTAASDTITAASTTITTIDVPIPTATIVVVPTLTAAPSRRRNGVVIRDPKDTTTTSIIIHSEAKSKDKGKGILTKEQMDEEDSRALKRQNESQEDKEAKKQKLDEEVEELKRHLQIVPNDEDDVYIEATPLACKLILLVERRYPLTRFTLDQMLNNVQLEVEEESKVSLNLLSVSFGVDAAEDFKENMPSD
nr:hypothetical protein [Tanacetum cinerariifolium]